MRASANDDLGLITASAIFTPADFFANASKQLILGQGGRICWPVQVVFAIPDSADPAWGAVKPQLIVQTSLTTWTWVTWDVNNGTTGTGDDWPQAIAGEGLTVTAAKNDLATWTAGNVEVLVSARRQRWPSA